MSALNDKQYYAARAAKAARLAETAEDPAIAKIHRRMADSYQELVDLSSGQRPTLRIVQN